MKTLCILAALIATIAADEQLWKSFKETHGKQYRSLLEDKLRYNIFQSNLKKIEEHNSRYDSGEETYTMAVNKFADMTKEEFISMLNTQSRPLLTKGIPFNESEYSVTADSIDWRTLGAVTPVKDQGSCGSCWSFSATGSLEGQVQQYAGQLISLSEQALIDCSRSYGNAGCNGGIMQAAYEYVYYNGLPTESAYPYRGVDGNCQGYTKTLISIRGYVNIGANNENSLAAAVGSVGPVSVAVDATNFQFYGSGIFTDNSCSSNSLNHGVLVVGYGSNNWIVKNSWGASWGESGYIRMARGYNQCGIAADASYPLLT